MISDYVDSQMQIGQVVQWTRKSHQGVALALDQGLYLGATGSRSQQY